LSARTILRTSSAKSLNRAALPDFSYNCRMVNRQPTLARHTVHPMMLL
jgi:hypothetical protein